jgi:hypothetical protein
MPLSSSPSRGGSVVETNLNSLASLLREVRTLTSSQDPQIFCLALKLGTGLGELSTVACSTRQGLRVAVLEKHYLPGGCCYMFDCVPVMIEEDWEDIKMLGLNKFKNLALKAMEDSASWGSLATLICALAVLLLMMLAFSNGWLLQGLPQ